MVRNWIFLCCLLFNGAVCAQTADLTDSTIQLPAYKAIGTTSYSSNAAFQVQHIDSGYVQTHLSSSVADFLERQSQMQIKAYGNSMLASPSNRGTAPQHTGVFWNGIDINQAVIGMTDLNLMPSIAAQNIGVWQGGNSALLGTGDMSGSIHLTTESEFKELLDVAYNQSVGSFGLRSETAQLHLSGKRIFSRTAFQYEAAKNDYSFKLPDSKQDDFQNQSNSAFKKLNFIEDLGFNLQKAGQIDLHYWYENVKRHIPPTLQEEYSKAKQNDESHRVVLGWEKLLKKWQFGAKVAYMLDGLTYDDTTSRIYSNYQLHTFVSKLHLNHYFGRHIKYFLNLQFNDYSVRNSNYIEDTLKRKMLKAGTGISTRFFKNKLRIDAAVALAKIDSINSPITPSLGVRYKPSKVFELRADASYNYTFPTFNDLYWQPGGNPNLKPEQGWSYQGGAVWQVRHKNYMQKLYFIGFSQQIENWIVWIPTAFGYWAPMNYKNVWSRGIELGGNLKHKITTNSSLKLMLNYSYTQCTSQEIENKRDAAIGHQLIYVPYYKANASLVYQFKELNIRLNGVYNGAEYTTSDNSSTLPAYYLINTDISYKFHIKKSGFVVGFQINNLLNQFYQPVLGYIMPGINYEANLKIFFKK